ncbi:hypothetical protein [Burkholderia glumae]|uniref:hypothetical protein n=1 Tax=Burkholderia glumae TaxID=337 RepID=UPI00157AFEBA|nr:hypothetical protein [Burkholderia glumae]
MQKYLDLIGQLENLDKRIAALRTLEIPPPSRKYVRFFVICICIPRNFLDRPAHRHRSSGWHPTSARRIKTSPPAKPGRGQGANRFELERWRFM